MKNYVSITLALVLCLTLFCVSAYSVNDVVVNDSGRGNLDQWVVSFKLGFDEATSKVPIVLNDYCEANDCEVIDISIEQHNGFLLVVAVVEK